MAYYPRIRELIRGSLDFDSTDPITISMWIYRTASGGTQHLLGKRYGSTINYQIAVYSDDTVTFGGPRGTGSVTSGGTTPLKEWTHITSVFDGSNVSIYLNGVLDSTSAATNIGGNNPYDLRIGRSGDEPGFAGSIDEVYIYDRVLTDSEIACLAGSRACRSAPSDVISMDPRKIKIGGIIVNQSDGAVGYAKLRFIKCPSGVNECYDCENCPIAEATSILPSGHYSVELECTPNSQAYSITVHHSMYMQHRVYKRFRRHTCLDPDARYVTMNFQLTRMPSRPE